MRAAVGVEGAAEVEAARDRPWPRAIAIDRTRRARRLVGGILLLPLTGRANQGPPNRPTGPCGSPWSVSNCPRRAGRIKGYPTSLPDSVVGLDESPIALDAPVRIRVPPPASSAAAVPLVCATPASWSRPRRSPLVLLGSAHGLDLQRAPVSLQLPPARSARAPGHEVRADLLGLLPRPRRLAQVLERRSHAGIHAEAADRDVPRRPSQPKRPTIGRSIVPWVTPRARGSSGCGAVMAPASSVRAHRRRGTSSGATPAGRTSRLPPRRPRGSPA